MTTSASYRRLVFRVDGEDEVLVAALWELGTLGTELMPDGRVTAYFESAESYRGVDWTAYSADLESDEVRRSEDWMSAYREASRPLPIGERLVIDPREPELSQHEAAAWPDRRLLRLPARTAFGTGSHASTRLVLELMEWLHLVDQRVLDVGFGSGVLSFAALEFGAVSVAGVEIDPEAALVAAQNRSLNGFFPRWVAGTVRSLSPSARFDVALVNVLPERVADDLLAIRELLELGGVAVFSGVPTDRVVEVADRLERAGFQPASRRHHQGWTALVVRAVGSSRIY